MPNTADKQNPAELIPWYLNGTLSPEERVRVEHYLAQGGEAAKAELELQRLIQSQASEQDGSLTPGEFGWKRLQRDLHRDAEKKKVLMCRSDWLRPAMAAAIAVIVIQAVLLNSHWSPSQMESLQPLSGTVAARGFMQIRFQPDTTALQISKLLQEIDAVVVNGPSAAGLYRIGLLDDSIANRKRVMQKLQFAKGIIEHVAEEQ
ncbi:zf-HC2 domain-containing protein [Sedimenticola selenatireducens]|uniref:Zf-HC2 domain-containing protein n=1 Tax=Sedimenticola selenatireducens TaxID=191960 RepID=A0A557S3Q4_9GAMM|nr:zf-HC2 domain-containing protein [Sedimenticola selenatireducens]TVO71957.1 zf-HC2 domain-containing protein [Sedimenticola selenatireducens]TVT66337.1 MAG: zf-HC2 domain-containing protein [Sedimenticola selenatireducens]